MLPPSEDGLELRKDWVNIAFLTFTPLIGVVGTALYTWRYGFHLWMPLLTLGMYLLVGFSICAGYHRYFAHKSYECSPLVQSLFAFFGAMAAQNSILWWASSHRSHHKYVDREWDPYNIRRGFWWAHIVWIFYRIDRSQNVENAPDLLKNRVVMWQNRWHKEIMILAGFGIPTLIGAAFGHPVAGLLWGGFLRIAVVHHTTFFVNSLAHSLGEPLYNSEVSARDNWLVALLTLGEGYHSFHHRFPSDFRNGIRWYHWDPAKWLIRGLRSIGFASELRATAPPQIEQARLSAAVRHVEQKLQVAVAEPHVGDQIRQRLREALAELEVAVALWRQHAHEQAEGMSHSWRETRRRAKHHIRQARRNWKDAVRMLQRLPQTA